MGESAWATISHNQGIAATVAIAFIVIAVFIVRTTSARSDRVFDAGLEIMRQMVAKVVSGDGNGGPSLASLDEKVDASLVEAKRNGEAITTLDGRVNAMARDLEGLTARVDSIPGCVAAEGGPSA